jgi:ABC-type nitrate/sulfonate/bicarbonate transport system permease component
MARLRSGVEARIAASAERRPSFRRTGWALALHTRWVGMATGGGFAIAAGLLFGAIYSSDPATDSVLTLLQPAPIHVWAD